jgi:hypothetical protein
MGALHLSSRNNVRIAVDGGGKPRCILSVKERTNGDLLLDIRGRQLAHPIGLPFATQAIKLLTEIYDGLSDCRGVRR